MVQSIAVPNNFSVKRFKRTFNGLDPVITNGFVINVPDGYTGIFTEISLTPQDIAEAKNVRVDHRDRDKILRLLLKERSGLALDTAEDTFLTDTEKELDRIDKVQRGVISP